MAATGYSRSSFSSYTSERRLPFSMFTWPAMRATTFGGTTAVSSTSARLSRLFGLSFGLSAFAFFLRLRRLGLSDLCRARTAPWSTQSPFSTSSFAPFGSS